MKKLSAALLAAVLFVPAMAGSIFTNLETTGEIQTIGTLTDLGTVSERDVSARLLFGVGVDLVEDVRANITFLNTNYWGTAQNNAGGSHATVNEYLDRIRIPEAYVTLSNIFNAFELKVGRQFYGDENSPVLYVGPTRYKGRIPATNPNINVNAKRLDAISLDAAVLTYTSDEFVANVIYSKIDDYNLLANVQGDIDSSVLGFDAKYFVNNNLYTQAYLYALRNIVDPILPDLHITNHGFWGLKAAYGDNGMAAAVEFAKNYEGRNMFNQNNRGWLLKADFSMDLAMDTSDITPRLTYFHTEKEFIAFGNYAPGILFGNYVSQIDLNNRRVINVGVDIKPAGLSKVTLALDYFALNYGPSQNAEWLGNEFNLMVKYALNSYVELHAGAAYMTHVGAYAKASNLADKSQIYGGQMGMIVRF